ncbi:MAG: serine/threonine-protein kinase [Candidatus Xenobia bacterium]
MYRKIWITAFMVCVAAPLCAAPTPPATWPEGTAARTWIRPASHIEQSWKLAPPDVPLPADRAWDVHLEAPHGFWQKWEGDQTEVGPLDTIHPAPRLVPDWPHILPCGGLLLLVLSALLVNRARARADKTLAMLDEAREAAAHAGLFPEDGSLPPRIGPYRVLGHLGSGGMAVVYRVADAGGNAMALKLPLPQVLDNQNMRDRFMREMKVARRLHHPNLVALLDAYEGDGDLAYPYLVMELLTGKTLAEWLRPRRSFPPEQAVALGLQVLSALQYMHENGVVHRDMKPSNLMITDGGQVKVMDFGIAGVENATLHLTQTGVSIGTLVYMSPEQLDGVASDGRSDLYSLGVVLYQMLAGRPPFDDDDELQLALSKMQHKLQPLSELCPELSPALCACVMRLLEPDPEQRHRNAHEALQDLQRFGAADLLEMRASPPGEARI